MVASSTDALLSTDFGLDALHEAALLAGVATSAWPRPVAPDALVTWLLEREKDAGVAEVLRLARIRVRYRGPAPMSVELVGKDARPLGDPFVAARSLEAGLVKALPERGFPASAPVHLLDTIDAFGLRVEMPSRWQPVTTATGDATLAYRRVPADLTYARGRLRVLTTNAVHAHLLVAEAGRAWFGDARFFSDAPLVALRALQRGPSAFEVPGELASLIARLRMIDFEWDSGGAVNVSFAGSDCPRDMRKLGFAIEGGQLLAATLRFDFTSAPWRADAVLRAPNELTCSEPSREPLVRRCLELLGALTHDAGPADLWDHEPWSFAEAAARAFFGAAFDELAQDRILLRSRSRAVVHPDHPRAGRRLIAFPIEGEPKAWYGATDGMRIPARKLTDADLVTWKLRLLRLGARIAKALGLEGRVVLRERRGVLDLGTRSMGPTSVRFFLLTRAPVDAVALAARLRVLASPGHAVLVVPAGRASGTGLAEVELARVEGPYVALLGDAARALGLAKSVDPVLVAPPGARVVVHVASRRVWFDGVLLTPLQDKAYRLVETLAKLAGEAMRAKALAAELGPGTDLDKAIRDTKYKLMKAIEASFAREGREVPQDAQRIVERVRNGEVRMGVAAFVA